MPKSKYPKQSVDPEAIAQYDALKDKYWLSAIKELMTIHKEQAFERTQTGFNARTDIFNRLWGKPQERREEESKQEIHIAIFPVINKEQEFPIEGTVLHLLPSPNPEPAQLLGQIKGEPPPPHAPDIRWNLE